MGAERRVHSRVRTNIRACMHSGGDPVEGVIENVGEGGVFFATEELESVIEQGAEVTVDFDGFRAGEPVNFRIRGTVLRTERYFDGRAVVRAFAVKFRDLLDLTGLSWS
ncbi:MAG: hypothetical protein HMLKMBBP_03738 [Planctomycetes bacterium]|nr:hypothetical protein [Planctomycetota bacterium]